MSLIIDDLHAAVTTLKQPGAVSSLFFILRDRTAEGINYAVRKSRISGELGKGFREALIAALEGVTGSDDLEICEYDPAYVSDRNSIEHVALDQLPKWSSIYEQINQVHNPDENTYDNKFFRQLWAYCIRTEVGGQIFLHFRKYSGGKVMQIGGALNFFFSRQTGTFSHLQGDVFQFDETIDCLVLNDSMVIFHKTAFEQIFSYLEKYQELAESTLKVVEQAGVIGSFDDLRDACMSDPRKLRKLADIGKYVDLHHLDFDRLKRVASEWAIDVGVDEDTKKISVQRRKVWGLIKLLSDDLLRSPLTDNRYVVNAKKRS